MKRGYKKEDAPPTPSPEWKPGHVRGRSRRFVGKTVQDVFAQINVCLKCHTAPGCNSDFVGFCGGRLRMTSSLFALHMHFLPFVVHLMSFPETPAKVQKFQSKQGFSKPHKNSFQSYFGNVFLGILLICFLFMHLLCPWLSSSFNSHFIGSAFFNPCCLFLCYTGSLFCFPTACCLKW